MNGVVIKLKNYGEEREIVFIYTEGIFLLGNILNNSIVQKTGI